MKKLLALLSISAITLAGCGASTVENVDPCTQYDSKIGMVTDTGGINDKSFNQGTYEGIQQYCEEFEVGAKFIESTDSSQYAANIEALASENEVVVAAGYYFESAIYDSAIAHPDVDFIIIDAEPFNSETEEYETLDNVQSYLFKEHEAGFLAGYVAGKTTQTNHIGFVGGEQVPAVQRFGYGYIAGAQAANPEIVVEYTYANTFTDEAIAKTTADTQITQGADVIFTAAGGANGGVVEAARTSTVDAGNTVWAVGVDIDMYDDGIYQDADGNEKSVILTSAVKHVGLASYEGIKAHFEDNFVGGTTVLGVNDEGAGLPETNPNVDDAIIDEAFAAFDAYGDIPQDADAVKELGVTINGNL